MPDSLGTMTKTKKARKEEVLPTKGAEEKKRGKSPGVQEDEDESGIGTENGKEEFNSSTRFTLGRQKRCVQSLWTNAWCSHFCSKKVPATLGKLSAWQRRTRFPPKKTLR